MTDTLTIPDSLLEALLEEEVACDIKDCMDEAKYRVRFTWNGCTCVNLMLLCGPHAEYMHRTRMMATLWECNKCGAVGPAGSVVITAL